MTRRREDASNDLSLLMLDAAASVKVSQPSIGLRYHNKLSEDLLLRSCEVIREGLGYPAIMNDDCIIPKQLVRKATLSEARDYCNNCVETEIPGMTDSRPHSGYVNFSKCMLLAMNDGVDPETGKRIGPATLSGGAGNACSAPLMPRPLGGFFTLLRRYPLSSPPPS